MASGRPHIVADPIALGDADVHLWLAASLDEGADEDWPQVLSPSERERAERFHFDRDRRVYCAAHLFLRRTLSRYAPLAPLDWQFITGEWGRPEIASPSTAAPGLRFNLSHSGGMAACAVTRHHDVGVDLEEIRPDRVADALLTRVLGPAELRALESLPPEARAKAFFECWTLKEAYVKATGRGFSIEPRDVQFELCAPDRARARFGETAAGDPAEWCFWRRYPTPSHIVSVAARGGTGVLHLVEPARRAGDGSRGGLRASESPGLSRGA